MRKILALLRGTFSSLEAFFDRAYYLRTQHDVRAAGADPFIHFMDHGFRERRNPSPYFHIGWYLHAYPEIKDSGQNPLEHFILRGSKRGYKPHYLIDLEYYLKTSKDVADSGVDPYLHFIRHGDREGRSPHHLFNPGYYATSGPSIGESAPFAHYSEYGARALRSPHESFDATHYAAMYPHEANEPLLHYVMAKGQRRHVHPLIDGAYQQVTTPDAANVADAFASFILNRSRYAEADKWRGALRIPKPSRALIARRMKADRQAKDQPKISTIVPCYKSNQAYLAACVNSILSQTYQNWELILVDDGSPDDSTWPALQMHAARDKRITAFRLEKNQGISGATNAGVEKATGEYLAFVDHDDVVASNAFSVMIDRMLSEDSDAAYSDQSFIDKNDNVLGLFPKPDFSPMLFSGVMYVGHLLIVKRDVAIAAGLFKSEFDGCQDYEFMLRVSEVTNKKICHVPQILYQWRAAEGSIAFDVDSKGKIEVKQAKAVRGHLERIGVTGLGVEEVRVPHRLKLRPVASASSMKVDVVVQGPASDAEITRIREQIALAGAAISSVNFTDWSRSTAVCIAHGKAEWLLFVDSNTRFVSPLWLAHLEMHASQNDAAFAAPHIYDSDGSVVAAGFVAAPGIGMLPAYQGRKEGEDGAFGSLICDREVSAVNAVCALVSRRKLEEIGGISEAFVTADGSVMDASFRATRHGWRNVSVATRLIEYESRREPDSLDVLIDNQFFLDRHREALAAGDRYYSPHYARERADFTIG